MKTIFLNAMRELTREVLNDVIEYLDDCEVFLPDFRHAVHRHMGGSYVTRKASGCFLHLGCYPTRFVTEWWVMHEVGHILWHFYQPCRDRAFNRNFGVEAPDDYEEIHRKLAFYGPLAHTLRLRPHGEPSPYGARGGGEERFCELIGLMYARGGFDQEPPGDLSALWNVCWNHGVARMTHDRIHPGMT